jgi:hypothetical protein
LEGQAGYTAAQMADIDTMHKGEITESKAVADVNIGTGLSLTGFLPLEAAKAVWKSLTLDYSFLYTSYTGMTQATCTATYANSRWQSASNTCLVPNVWFLPFLLLTWGPIAAVGIYFLLYLLRGN